MVEDMECGNNSGRPKGIMEALALLVLLTVGKGDAYTATPNPLSDEFIDYINQQQSTWKAGRNFPKDTPMEYVRGLVGTHIDNDTLELPFKVLEDVQVPEHFDSRQQWPNCPTIGEIGDQGHCSSSWGFAIVEVISDRICIHSNGTTKVRISASDLIFCYPTEGDNTGCDGGRPIDVWLSWIFYGFVTGGPYGSNQGCSPYRVAPGEAPGPYPCLPCIADCIPSYPLSYHQDKHFGKSIYKIRPIVKQIQAEIFKNGPVTGGMLIYDDFFAYKSGVYKRASSVIVGGLSVKILGWGVEGGTPYWLVANSWNTTFGEQGFFKILRGSNECMIEWYILTGLPRL